MGWFLYDRDYRHERVNAEIPRYLIVSDKVFTLKLVFWQKIVEGCTLEIFPIKILNV